MHPSASEKLLAAPEVDCPFCVTDREEDIKKVLTAFRPGSSGGTDRFRCGHLQTLISDKAKVAGERLRASLTRFVSFTLRQEVLQFAQSIMDGAVMLFLNKKGQISPIDWN